MFSFLKKSLYISACILACVNTITSHDILVEGKAALFLPKDQTLKSIYGISGDFGFEITGEIAPHVYGFASFDFIDKSGTTPALGTPTKLYTNFFGVGLKCFIPTNFGDFYIGLGAEPTYLKTVNQSKYVEAITTNWGCGGIAKMGAIVNLPNSFFVDLYIDYSFVHFDFTQPFGSPVQSTTAILDGALFGIGFGYRFN